ncbi:hypothetical protein [Nesterenkonia pannonica]|nr:hypothetical protein [Nesterenkonia pannonica]
MSDLPAGEWAQDWDALYWAFVRDHRDTLSSNPRAQMMVAMLDRMDSEKRASHHDRADRLLAGQSRTGLLARPEASHQPEE